MASVKAIAASARSLFMVPSQGSATGAATAAVSEGGLRVNRHDGSSTDSQRKRYCRKREKSFRGALLGLNNWSSRPYRQQERAASEP
jgi:hypothetical protein